MINHTKVLVQLSQQYYNHNVLYILDNVQLEEDRESKCEMDESYFRTLRNQLRRDEYLEVHACICMYT